jgi:hypothetical protein
MASETDSKPAEGPTTTGVGPRALSRLRAVARPRDWLLGGRALLLPLLLSVVPLFWVIDATYRSSVAPLGRDQGIFQYVAWALRNGEVDYRDVRDVNGPLTHLVHMVMLALGGADEHRFRMIDLWVNGAVFAFVGACLPGLGARAGRRASAERPSPLDRLAWAFAAWVLLSAQYVMYLYWDQAQRESFCDWFLLPGLALQLAAWSSPRAAARRVVLVGALSVVPWFGKPTFVVFTAVQLLGLLADDRLPLPRTKRLGLFALGGALGAVGPMAFLLRYGHLGAYLRIVRHDVPEVYRFIWARTAPEIFGDEGPLLMAATGLAAGAFVLALVAVRTLPRRALVLALLPLAGIANVTLQQKGFTYHFHPLTAGTWIAVLAVLVALWERHRAAPRAQGASRLAILGLGAAVSWHVASGLAASPNLRNVWILALGDTAELRAEREYLDHFKTDHYSLWDMREAAAMLRASTGPYDRVQTYGMDPYLLFLAERRSATPYVYAYDLDAAAALAGGWSNRPTDGQRFHIAQARDEHERDMLRRVREKPPAAFVFMDHAPLVAYPDAFEDFQNSCPESAAWVSEHYRETSVFGIYRVWLRNDLPAPPAGPPAPPPP